MAQVLLDRSGHSPGVVDGVMGGNTTRAIEAFQRANGIVADGKLSAALLERLGDADSANLLQRYTIADQDVAGPFVEVPDDMEDQAELDTLAYESPAEGIAEKFHMAQAFLEALNPSADFGRAGTEITVVVPGKDEVGADVMRIEVDKAASTLRAYGANAARDLSSDDRQQHLPITRWRNGSRRHRRRSDLPFRPRGPRVGPRQEVDHRCRPEQSGGRNLDRP